MKSPDKQSPLAAIAQFLPYLWPEGDRQTRGRVLIASFLLVLQKAITVAIPLIYGWVVDVIATENFALGLMFATIGAYVVSRLLQQIFEELKYYVFARVGQHAIRVLALQVFEHLHALSLRFHLNRQTGGLTRVIERGTKSIEFLLTFALFNIIPTLVEIVFVCAIFWLLFEWHFSIAAFVTISGYVAYTILVTEWRTQFRRLMNEYDKHANTRAVDSLLNYETVKYFNAEDYEKRRYDEAMRKYEDSAVRNRTSLSLLNIGQGFIIAIGMGVIMSLGGLGVSQGDYTIGLFASINMYLLQLYLPLNFLGTVYRELRQALLDMEEMFSLLAQHPDVRDAPTAGRLTVANGTVTFQGVTFSYGRGINVLRDVSFTVPGGTKTAIVGPSGGGKSTLTRLLYRFYDPDDGRILIDGQDIRQFSQHSVRGLIGVVPQDTVLFNDTLRYNLCYGSPDTSDDDFQEAIRLAEIETFIRSLPEGAETQVGERGLKLSGGEKQRVAIARAILKRPLIYIFDEATSALDTRTEKALQRALDGLAQTRTTLVIAHRLSTIVDADNIIVLSEGRIIEQGRHNSLLQQGGLYASLWHRQENLPESAEKASASSH